MKSPNETKIKMEEGKKGKEGETERQTETDRQIEAGRQTDGQTDRKRLITIMSMVKILAQRLTEISAVVACDD